jgi:hypothetical protein
VPRSLARAAAVADRRVTGLSRAVLVELVAELRPRWQSRRDARLADRPRRRAVGAGARHRLVFVDRLLADGSACAVVGALVCAHRVHTVRCAFRRIASGR